MSRKGNELLTSFYDVNLMLLLTCSSFVKRQCIFKIAMVNSRFKPRRTIIKELLLLSTHEQISHGWAQWVSHSHPINLIV